MLTPNWTCEICGRKGPPNEPVTCCRGRDFHDALKPVEISIFRIGVYSLKVCSDCHKELGHEGLRDRIRKKVRQSQSEKRP